MVKILKQEGGFRYPTDRRKSVRNRCVMEVFGGVFCIVTLLLEFFCGYDVGAFVIGLSQISSFYSSQKMSAVHIHVHQ